MSNFFSKYINVPLQTVNSLFFLPFSLLNQIDECIELNQQPFCGLAKFSSPATTVCSISLSMQCLLLA